MTKEKDYINFIPGVLQPEETNNADLFFIFSNDKLLVKISGEGLMVPEGQDVEKLRMKITTRLYMGKMYGIHCYCLEVEELFVDNENMEWMDLRSAGLMLEEELFFAAGRAAQLLYWDKTNKFCSSCGSAVESRPDERAKVCPKCGFMSFPRISPAVIVAVTRGKEILLAHNFRFQNNMYSVIAGFVEPGETFEDCVKREVLEEVGVRVKNIKYFGSQPWPFPNSLMIAFTAEYEGGDIEVDGVEIEHAGWFNVDNLPNTPAKISVASKLIKWFIENKSN
jgi:NAD+ diphosphatase